MTETIKIDIEDQQLNTYLQKLQTLLADMSPIMERAASVMAGATDKNFAVEGRPPWHPLSKAYAKSKQEARGKNKKTGEISHLKILTLTGQLRSSISKSKSWGKDFAQIGSNKEYAAIHQFGGDITIPPHRRDVYFHYDRRTGEVGTEFVKKAKSNFAQEVDHPGGRITMPARPYLQLTVTDLESIRTIVQQAITNPS